MPKKDELKFNSADIPYILNNMTQTPDGTNPVPGTEVHEIPGLIPETPNAIPGYDPTTASAPGEYDPNTVTPLESDEYDPIAPEYPNSTQAHQDLLNDPKYAVHVHEAQIGRIIELLEEVTGRLVTLEDKLLNLDLDVRFSKSPAPDGPPEPPTGTDYGQAIN